MRYLRYIFVIILVAVAFSLIYSRFSASYHDIPLLFKEAQKKLLWLLPILAIIYYVIFGFLSKTILAIAGSKVSIRETAKVGLLGALGFQVAPFVGGAILIYLFYKKLKVSSSRILFLVTTTFALNLFNVFLFFSASILLLKQSFFSFLPQREVLTLLLVLLFLFCLGFWLLRNNAKSLILLLQALAGPINKISLFFKKKEFLSQSKVERIIKELLSDLNLISSNPTKSLQALGLSMVFYLTNISILFLSFYVFGYETKPPFLIIGLTLASILAILSLFPEAPGVMEASLVTVFIGLGFPAHVSLFAVLLYRLVLYWLAMPFGFLVYLSLNGQAAKGKQDFLNGEN